MTSITINVGAANGCDVKEFKKFINGIYANDTEYFYNNEWVYFQKKGNKLYMGATQRGHIYFNLLELGNIDPAFDDKVYLLEHNELKGLKTFFKGLKVSEDIEISIHDKYTVFYRNSAQLIISHDLNGSQPFDAFDAMEAFNNMTYHETMMHKKNLDVLKLFECYYSIISNKDNKLLLCCYDGQEIRNAFKTSSDIMDGFRVAIDNTLLKRLLSKTSGKEHINISFANDAPLIIRNGHYLGVLANRLLDMDMLSFEGYESVLKEGGLI